MKIHHFRSKKASSGFTLMEVLVVIAIIAVLATMTVGGLGFYKRKAAENRTQVFVASVSQALSDYHSDSGVYPEDGADGSDASSAILYEVLFGDADADGESDDGATIYLDTLNPSSTGPAKNVDLDGGDYVLIDGWKNPLYYRAPGEQNPDFDLWSAGFDGETSDGNTGDETRDDIDNW